MSFSQNDEESILLRHFADAPPGRLLDCGAWSPTCLSNSRALIELGWSAVLVEPSPKPFCGLLDAYGGNPNVTLVNSAIADSAGLKTWHDSGGDAVSTLDDAHRKKWDGQASYRAMYLATVTVGDLLRKFGDDYAFLNVDLEGCSALTLARFPIAAMPRLKAIVCEHDGYADALASWAGPFGFKEAGRNAENVVLLR